MNSRQLFKKLKDEGWKCAGGKGDHKKFKHPKKPGHVVVPHPRKDIPVGTLRSIYRQAEWDWPPR
jgi:predicted RNA binding protein YcfA (HicA-like mRNA interferase family)